MHSILRY